jgi:hypothetical protein
MATLWPNSLNPRWQIHLQRGLLLKASEEVSKEDSDPCGSRVVKLASLVCACINVPFYAASVEHG